MPSDITKIKIQACGAQGASRSGKQGGSGAAVAATFQVEPGTVWNIIVGCPGSGLQGGTPNGGNGKSYGAGGNFKVFEIRSFHENSYTFIPRFLFFVYPRRRSYASV